MVSDAGNVISQKDYAPYGDELWQGGIGYERRSWIGKEEDRESDLGDFGVRKYDSELGRFLQIDGLWEGYRWWNPYQYALNSPLIARDANGLVVEARTKADQQQVVASVEAEVAAAGGIVFDKDGILDKRVLLRTLKSLDYDLCGNSNAATLYRMADNEKTTKVMEVALTYTIPEYGKSLLNMGLAGITVYPTVQNGAPVSPTTTDGKIHCYVVGLGDPDPIGKRLLTKCFSMQTGISTGYGWLKKEIQTKYQL